MKGIHGRHLQNDRAPRLGSRAGCRQQAERIGEDVRGRAGLGGTGNRIASPFSAVCTLCQGKSEPNEDVDRITPRLKPGCALPALQYARGHGAGASPDSAGANGVRLLSESVQTA